MQSIQSRIAGHVTAGCAAAAALPLAPSTAFKASSKVSRLQVASAKGKDADDADDDEAPAPGKALRVERLLANLGYGKRKECQQLVQKGKAVRRNGERLKVGAKVLHSDILLEGEELDVPFPVAVMVHKPVGYVVTAPDDDKILDPKVYDLLPYRFGRRRPFLSSVGRLDKATSGMLLLTDDGQLVHRINTPKKGIWKVYEATLAAPMTEKEAETAAKRFASGTLVLQGDFEPLLPAKLIQLGGNRIRVSICEGRYHQIRRMLSSVGHEVTALHRVSVGGLGMQGLPGGEWKYLTQADLDSVFSGPTTDDVLAGGDGGSADTLGGASLAGGDTSRVDSGGTESSSVTSLSFVSPVGRDEAEAQQRAAEDAEEDELEAGIQLNVVSPDKKMREDEKWRKRRSALKKMVGNM